MGQAIVLFSGGLDSTVSLKLAQKHYDVKLALTFVYGQRSAQKEMESAAYFCTLWEIEHKTIELPFFNDFTKSSLISKSKGLPLLSIEEIKNSEKATIQSAKAVWVPNRNGLFINIAAAYAEENSFDFIVTGFNKEEAATFPDNSKKFVSAINSSLSLSTLTGPKVISLIQKFDKVEILKKAFELNIDISKIWCCYDGHDKWCGKCESCLRLLNAMQKLDMDNDYENNYFKK